MRINIKLLISLALISLHWAQPVNAANEWPREIAAEGRTILMYQPQLDKLVGNILYGRAAVSITPIGTGDPIFGAVWLEARIETDLTSRTVSMLETRMPKVHFTGITPEQKKEFAALCAREIPSWNLSLSLDRMITMLDIAEKQNLASGGFDDSPPIIIIADKPTVLVNIDGEPQFVPVEGSDAESIINTPFLILRNEKNLYLSAGAQTWYTATSIAGPWTIAAQVPPDVQGLEPQKEQTPDADKSIDKNELPPAILVTTEPTELINIDGPPQHKALPGNKLNYISNADADLFMEISSQRYFVLLSGRWFVAKSWDGPWKFVAADHLPESFAEIPAGMDEGDVRTWVAGTEEAKDAVLEAYIPQTAAIRRDATITVEYDGSPQFEKIETTGMKYAVNTASQVIQADQKFYCADQGAWYVANAAEGPWITAIEIPDEIRSIPASNPMYNVKFLYIYGHNDEVVFFGYYSGYTHSYIYYETIVYGTGWYYRPWRHHHHYYPHPCTWGYHMRWHRWHGWRGGCRYTTGRYSFSIGEGRHYHRGLWGPTGYRRNGNSGHIDTRRSVYQNQDNANRVAKNAQRPDIKQPALATNRKNDVFADKNGNIMRKNDQGNWERRKDGQWAESRPEGKPEERPQQKPRQSLDRDQQARDRGNQRSNSYQQSHNFSRPSGGSRRGGGRGGGGRR